MKQFSILALLALWLTAVAVAKEEATNNVAATPYKGLGLGSSYNTAAQILDKSIKPAEMEKDLGKFVLDTVNTCRSNAYAIGKSPNATAGLGGNWLEYTILYMLQQKKLTPAYWQAEFKAVPNAFNDVTVWSQEHGPIIMSCKTSLRERYKQADLEALALRGTYPKGKFFIITIDEDKKHVANIRKKLTNGEVLALQAVYDETNMDELFEFLKTQTITEPPPGILRSGSMVR